MNFKNPSGKQIGDFALPILGYVTGAMLSRGLVSAIHTPKAVAGTDEAKKEATMLLVKRGAIIGASVYAGAGISGTDTTSVLAKAVSYGMAGMQTIDTIKHLAGNSPKLADTSTKGKKILASSLGLACPETETTTVWGMGRARRRSSLRIPEMSNIEATYSPADAIYDNAMAMTT